MSVKMFKDSFLEVKSVKNLCIISILMAMNLTLCFVGTIKLTDYAHISFGFLVFFIVGTMYGPVVSFLFGFFADILGFYVRANFIGVSGRFHLGFTLTSVLSATFYGLFLYKYKLNASRVIIVEIVKDLICNWFLNSLFLAQLLFNNDFKRAFFLRLPKECCCIVINCVLVLILANSLKRVAKGLNLN